MLTWFKGQLIYLSSLLAPSMFIVVVQVLNSSDVILRNHRGNWNHKLDEIKCLLDLLDHEISVFGGNLIFSLTHRTSKCDIAYWLKIKFLIHHMRHKQLLCGYVNWWSSTKFEFLNSKMDSNNRILFNIGPYENTKAFSQKSWLTQICTLNIITKHILYESEIQDKCPIDSNGKIQCIYDGTTFCMDSKIQYDCYRMTQLSLYTYGMLKNFFYENKKETLLGSLLYCQFY